MAPMISAKVSGSIDAALEVSPCGRCGQEHTLSLCPANDSVGMKGTLWQSMERGPRKVADEYLKAHAAYKYVAPPPGSKKTSNKAGGKGVQQQQHGGGQAFGTSTSQGFGITTASSRPT
jgi:hypothetical protein